MQVLVTVNYKIILLCVLCACSLPILAQKELPAGGLSNKRYLWVKPAQLGQPFKADSLTLYPPSLHLASCQPSGFIAQNDLHFQVDLTNNLLTVFIDSARLHQKPFDSLQIGFRVLPYRLDQTEWRYNRADYQAGKLAEQDSLPFVLKAPVAPEPEALFTSESLQKNGSLTRGLSFGNTQNVFVNSALNLQIEGYLTDDIYLTAAISDQQVPFQPDGNTQQIQDFDRVYLELKHQQALLKAGDITLQQDSASYFLQYFKNVQGAQAEAYWQKESKGEAVSATQLGASLARGQFRTQWLSPQEGVLGPYRLSGPANERFLIVMANSEKIWLDGRLLQRGFQNDYIIDYNQAEITFTPNVLITRFSRIRVDFEYATQEYARTILQANHRQVFKKGETHVRLYREKDNENAPLGFELGEAEKTAFQLAGDRPNAAFTVPIDTLNGFSPDRILYTAKDTTVNGITYPIFQRATPQSTQFLQVSFTYVGPGNGHYLPENSTQNGQVFRWVAPVNRQPQGTYAPGRPLTAPNLRQMVSAGGHYEVGHSGKVYAEVAVSNQDLNLLSAQDDADNQGMALMVGYENKGISLGNRWTVYGNLQLEYDQPNFRPIDRFRAVEFDRDWSLNLDSLGQQTDRIGKAKIGVRKQSEHRQTQHDFSYEAIARQRTYAVNGLQHQANWQSRFRFLSVKADALWLKAELPALTSASYQTDWKRANLTLSVPGKKVVPGYTFYLDQNAVRNQENKVVRSAMHAQSHTFFIETADSLRWNLRTEFTLREDQTPVNGEMAVGFRSQTASLKAKRNWQRNLLALTLTLRDQQQVLNPNQPNETTINGRLDWRQQWWQGNLHSDVTWQTAASQELRREYVFVKVATGLGTHTWRDDNADGLQDLNEFYEAINPDERNYVKYFVPTTEYVPAYQALYNHRIRFQFPQKWLSEKGIKNVLARISGQWAFVAERKTNANEWQKRFLPVGASLAEGELLSEKTSFRSNLFFNQRHPTFGADWQFFRANRQQLLTNGFENHQQRDHTLTLRWNLSTTFSSQTSLSRKSTRNQSDWLAERNFSLQGVEFSPEISWQPSPTFRLSTAFSVRKKEGNTTSAEATEANANSTASFTEATLKVRWAKAVSRSLNAEWQVTRIGYTGTVNSPLGYEMLEALQPGQNLRWQVFFTQKVTKGLQMNLTYNGRKSGSQPVVHIGQMQVTALF